MPPPAVSVVELKAERIPILNELPGRVAPTRIAEVRPRISGIVVERVFEQGSLVEEGDVLYRIDPQPFRVQVESAEATLERAKASQLQARQLAERQEKLSDRNIVSQQQRDDAIAALAQANADVAIAEAGLAAARLDLDYANVKAPISGRIGRALITEGALVNPNNAESLATIQQLDPIYVDFTQPVNEMLRLKKALESGKLAQAGEGAARVRLKYDDGSEYEHAGKLLFQEAAVDATTGQVTLRAEFPNPDGDLLPGMYMRVLIEQGVQQQAIAVPKQAIQRDATGQAQVYTVNGEGIAEMTVVTVGRAIGDRWLIENGLEPGQKIVVEGFQKIRPGAQVIAEEWKPQNRQLSSAGTNEPENRKLAKAETVR
ncbi:efflux RND transporter periplasmic adaptor subunit [Mesorhizobium sp. J18]|uniref:efflux RND transporter periplasmic adaptor subunit n=1 Tax=Mesorhizobium sp. J18 TaxID=935263 RepID=UPI001FEDA623|nr:efflux RND transporter periplasmic adaptor subunit [Mesorhizobium sp. J18]